MFAGCTYGGFVFGAGLVVAAFTPVPPATHDSGNGYGTAQSGAAVYAAGSVVTSQTPVPPSPATHDRSNGYGVPVYGAGSFGSGVIVTSQAPTPPTQVVSSGGIGHPTRRLAISGRAFGIREPLTGQIKATVDLPARGHSLGFRSPLTGKATATAIPWDMTPAGEEELLLALFSL